MAVKTPAPERAAGRRKLAASGKALPGGSFPIPNRAYLKKAIQAVGRAAPGKRPALGRLIRKRARALGAWSTVKGSWADNTQSAKAMSSALRATLELSVANGEFVWELANQPQAGEMDRVYKRAYAMAKGQGKDDAACTKFAMGVCKRYAKNKGYPPSAVKKPSEYANGQEALEFVGPKGYEHGWKYVGGPGLPKIAAGAKIRFPQSSGVHEGKVTEVSGQHLHVHVTKGAKAGQDIRVHSGMVTHVHGGGTKTPSMTGAEHTATDTAAAKAKYSPAGQDAFDEARQSGRSAAQSHLAAKEAESGGPKYSQATFERVIHRVEGLPMGSSATLGSRSVRKRPGGYDVTLGSKTRHYPKYADDAVRAMLSGRHQSSSEKPKADMSLEDARGRAAQAATQKPKVNAPTQPKPQTKIPGGNTQPPVQTGGSGLTPGASDSATKSSALAKDLQSSDHAQLLKNRTAMRAKYPQGHPERLKAERAVRQSRKTRRAGEGGSSGGVVRRTAVAGTPRRRTSRTATPVGKTSAPSTGKSVAEHQAEYGQLKPYQRRAYDKAKLQGIGHERSMTVAKSAPTPPKGTAGRAVRKAENKAARESGVTMSKAQERSTRPHDKAKRASAAASREIANEIKVSPADSRLAARLGITVEKVKQMRALAVALERRGWSQSEARKLAAARIVHGTPIPQFAPGKKIARTNRT